MSIKELQDIYAKHPNVSGLASLCRNKSVKNVFLEGMHGSCASLFASAFVKSVPGVYVFILNDLEEAGYFYHDMVQVNGDADILFFPSSYRRAIKYGQKDAANEILRTEVLSRLERQDPVAVVTYPEALAEKVVSRKQLSASTLTLKVGQKEDTGKLMEKLSSYGFEHVDYVYEPGQFALRGSILDVYSFASEYPYRIDFFGDEIDSIRTFEVETQLSKEKKESVSIVPELSTSEGSDICFLDFIPKETILWVKDLLWVREHIRSVHEDTLSPQALKAYEGEQTELMNLSQKLIDGAEFTVRALEFFRVDFGHKAIGTPQARLAFETSVQPIFHKNFDLVSSSFTDFLQRGYRLYICSDSAKQTERLKDIFQEEEIRLRLNRWTVRCTRDLWTILYGYVCLQTIRYSTVSINTTSEVTKPVAERWPCH